MNHTLEPNWQPINKISSAIEEDIRDWLTVGISLTERLQSLGKFKVEVLQECWENEKSETWIRDVVLKVNEKPKVIARTQIPKKTLHAIPKLQTLGNHSIGDLIFKELKGKREKLEFARIYPEHELFKLAAPYCRTKVKKLYARRSLICVQAQQLLINEAFIFGN